MAFLRRENAPDKLKDERYATVETIRIENEKDIAALPMGELVWRLLQGGLEGEPTKEHGEEGEGKKGPRFKAGDTVKVSMKPDLAVEVGEVHEVDEKKGVYYIEFDETGVWDECDIGWVDATAELIDDEGSPVEAEESEPETQEVGEGEDEDSDSFAEVEDERPESTKIFDPMDFDCNTWEWGGIGAINKVREQVKQMTDGELITEAKFKPLSELVWDAAKEYAETHEDPHATWIEETVWSLPKAFDEAFKEVLDGEFDDGVGKEYFLKVFTVEGICAVAGGEVDSFAEVEDYYNRNGKYWNRNTAYQVGDYVVVLLDAPSQRPIRRILAFTADGKSGAPCAILNGIGGDRYLIRKCSYLSKPFRSDVDAQSYIDSGDAAKDAEFEKELRSSGVVEDAMDAFDAMDWQEALEDSDEGDSVVAEDEESVQDEGTKPDAPGFWEKHCHQYHPKGFKEGSICKYLVGEERTIEQVAKETPEPQRLNFEEAKGWFKENGNITVFHATSKKDIGYMGLGKLGLKKFRDGHPLDRESFEEVVASVYEVCHDLKTRFPNIHFGFDAIYPYDMTTDGTGGLSSLDRRSGFGYLAIGTPEQVYATIGTRDKRLYQWMIRHEIGHSLSSEYISSRFEELVGEEDKRLLHGILNAICNVGDAWLTDTNPEQKRTAKEEVIADLFAFYTAPKYKKGYLPSKIESFLREMVEDAHIPQQHKMLTMDEKETNQNADSSEIGFVYGIEESTAMHNPPIEATRPYALNFIEDKWEFFDSEEERDAWVKEHEKECSKHTIADAKEWMVAQLPQILAHIRRDGEKKRLERGGTGQDARIDPSDPEFWEKHDRAHHHGQYDPETQRCSLREEMGVSREKAKEAAKVEEVATELEDEIRDNLEVGNAPEVEKVEEEEKVEETVEEEPRGGITQEEDAAYIEAVERGDMETAGRMVREAAAKAMSDTKVVDEDGKPRMVYHGTVRDFTVFDKTFSNPEGDMGSGYYFSSSEEDVDANYATEQGADLTNRLEKISERIESESENDEDDAAISHEEALRRARQELQVGEGRKLNVFLNITNPFVIGSKDGGNSGASSTWLDFTEEYDEETDEYGDPSGSFVDFVNTLDNVIADHGLTIDTGSLYEKAYDYGGMDAGDLVKECKDLLMYAEDDEGNLIGNEVLREAIERAGYDGIIDASVNSKFGSRSKYKAMEGMDDDTVHYIAFSPEQIKLADEVTRDDEGDVIPLSERFNEKESDIRFSRSGEGGEGASKEELEELAGRAKRFLAGTEIEVVDRAYDPEVDADEETRKSIGGIYTGSAADYDKPSLIHVGEGEGSQVYGWGLYGSNVRGVAESYAGLREDNQIDRIRYKGNGLGSVPNYTDEGQVVWKAADALVSANGDVDKAIERLKSYGADKAAMFLDKNKKDFRLVDDNDYLYEQTFFTDRAPGDESHLLKWYEPVSEEQKHWIKTQAEKEGIIVSGLVRNLRDGGYLYERLTSIEYLGSPKAASEFLARAGIDGVKYPVDSYGGKGVKDGDKVGWNYVSFRDDNIRVDHKWVDGHMLFMRGAGGKVVGTYDRNTNKVTLYKGATAHTLVHELGGHATMQFAQQCAKEGNDVILQKINDSIDRAPESVKAAVKSKYPDVSEEVLRDEIWAAVCENRSQVREEAEKTEEGKAWWRKAWQTAKACFAGVLTKMGIRTDWASQKVKDMTPAEFTDFVVGCVKGGKTIGGLRKGDESDAGGHQRQSIIGERGAKNLGIGKLDDARKMEESGADREKIWRETGWWRGNDGKWRYELPEVTREEVKKITRSFMDAYKSQRESGEKKPYPYAALGWNLGNMAQRLGLKSIQKLIKSYPELANVEFRGNNTSKTKDKYRGVTAFMKERDSEGRLVPHHIEVPLGFRTNENITRAVIHELQHVIQAYEGFPNGGTDKRGSVENQVGDKMAPSEVKYDEMLGEKEARNAARRDMMTAEERASNPPWETEDTGKVKQENPQSDIVKMTQGGQV